MVGRAVQGVGRRGGGRRQRHQAESGVIWRRASPAVPGVGGGADRGEGGSLGTPETPYAEPLLCSFVTRRRSGCVLIQSFGKTTLTQKTVAAVPVSAAFWGGGCPAFSLRRLQSTR